MPMPMQYFLASRDFEAFMADLLEISMLKTSHQGYTMLQSVLQVFRRRLTLPQAIAFSNLLPPVLRAIFVSDWDVGQSLLPFVDRQLLMQEVMQLRHNHNLSTPTAIEDVTAAIRRHVDEAKLESFLRELPEGALSFWGFQTKA